MAGRGNSYVECPEEGESGGMEGLKEGTVESRS